MSLPVHEHAGAGVAIDSGAGQRPAETSQSLTAASDVLRFRRFGWWVLAITIAVISNSVVKSGIAVYSGGWRYGRLIGLVLMTATGAGLSVLLLT